MRHRQDNPYTTEKKIQRKQQSTVGGKKTRICKAIAVRKKRAAAEAQTQRTKVACGHAHGAGSLTEEAGLARARRLGNGIVSAGAFQKAPSSEFWGGDRSHWEGEGPIPRFRWSFKVRERTVSRLQSTGVKGSGSPSFYGDPARKHLSFWAPLSRSRSALGSGQPHKGRAARAAQAREPPWLLGVVVRPGYRAGRRPPWPY